MIGRIFRFFMAHALYMRRPVIQFLPVAALGVALLFFGGYLFHRLQGESYARGLYITYCLLLMEHITEEVPKDWALRTLYVVYPLVGLVIVLDGIVRFSYHVLRRNETGKEWVSSVAKTMNNHVVLCGLGKMGLRVLEQLLELGETVIVLEKDDNCANLSFAKKNKVPVLIGHSREEGIFNDLNVKGAKSIICATDDDLANLEMALDARQIHPGIRVVLRMFDHELASKVRDAFDIQLAFSTTAIAAPLFATGSSDRTIVNSFYVGDQLLVVAKLQVNPGSSFIGKKISEIAKQTRAFFLDHTRGGKSVFYPPGDTTLAEGDGITLQTHPKSLKWFHQENGDKV